VSKPRSAKKTSAATTRIPRRWTIAFGCMMVAIAYSGLQVVDAAAEARALYQRLGEVQREEDGLLEENSRLSLQRSSMSNLQKVEEVAQEQLDMEFPNQVLPTVIARPTP